MTVKVILIELRFKFQIQTDIFFMNPDLQCHCAGTNLEGHVPDPDP